jgi:hypothetical protein
MLATGGVFQIRYDTSELSHFVTARLTTAADLTGRLSVLGQYSQYNDATGGYIKFLPENSYCPALVGKEGQHVFLFRFVEVLDELIDYEKVREQLPGLSSRQIGGAIAFLRKVAQFNCAGVNIDDLIDSAEASDETLVTNLRSTLSAQGESVVLNMP